MTIFEERMGYILEDFKNGKLNYAETILKVEELVNNCLGFSMVRSRDIEAIYKEVSSKNESK